VLRASLVSRSGEAPSLANILGNTATHSNLAWQAWALARAVGTSKLKNPVDNLSRVVVLFDSDSANNIAIRARDGDGHAVT
jgi:hypothetical protein